MPWIKHGKISAGIGLVVILIALIFSYVYCYNDGVLDDVETHIAYTLIYLGLGLLLSMVRAAGCITAEKEARTFPILLTSTLNERQIINGKWFGALRRSLPVWLLLAGHLLIFIFAGWIHPIALLHVSIIAVGSAMMLTASGIFFSACFKRSVTAVLFNLGFAVILWLITPATGFGFCCFFGGFLVLTNPMVLAGVAMSAAAGAQNAGLPLTQLEYPFVYGEIGFYVMNVGLFVALALYVGLSIMFLRLAEGRLRKNIF